MVCVCVCVCLQVYTLAPGSSRTGTIPTGSPMQSLSPSFLLLFIKSICVGLYRRHVCVLIVKKTVCRIGVWWWWGVAGYTKLLFRSTWILFCTWPCLLLGLPLFCVIFHLIRFIFYIFFPVSYLKPAAKKSGWHSVKWSKGFVFVISRVWIYWSKRMEQ